MINIVHDCFEQVKEELKKIDLSPGYVLGVYNSSGVRRFYDTNNVLTFTLVVLRQDIDISYNYKYFNEATKNDNIYNNVGYTIVNETPNKYFNLTKYNFSFTLNNILNITKSNISSTLNAISGTTHAANSILNFSNLDIVDGKIVKNDFDILNFDISEEIYFIPKFESKEEYIKYCMNKINSYNNWTATSQIFTNNDYFHLTYFDDVDDSILVDSYLYDINTADIVDFDNETYKLVNNNKISNSYDLLLNAEVNDTIKRVYIKTGIDKNGIIQSFTQSYKSELIENITFTGPQEQFLYSNFLVDNSEVKTFEFDINTVNPEFNEEKEEVKSMNFTGGYQMVDFMDVNLSTEEVKIPGVYKTIESNNRKPILLHRGTVNGIERADCFAFATVDDSKFNLYYGNPKYYIEVTAEDMVKLVAIV